MTSMKNMRRQMRMARDKGITLVVAGSQLANESAAADEGVGNDNDRLDKQSRSMVSKSSLMVPVVTSKARMSKAERRRMKKDPNAPAAPTVNKHQPEEKRKKNMRGLDFRDNAFFIENDFSSNSEEAQRQRRMEAAMQPSAANSVKGITGNAMRLEEAML
eukprot:jgi/Psemu1/302752/fgenesh1_kg.79_\